MRITHIELPIEDLLNSYVFPVIECSRSNEISVRKYLNWNSLHMNNLPIIEIEKWIDYFYIIWIWKYVWIKVKDIEWFYFNVRESINENQIEDDEWIYDWDPWYCNKCWWECDRCGSPV